MVNCSKNLSLSMYKLILIALLLIPFSGKSAHILGSDVYYRSIGLNQYEITFKIYRDCTPGGSGAQLDNPLHYTIFRSDNNDAVDTVRVNLESITSIPASDGDPCVIVPPQYCVQMGLYIDTVTLPPSLTGYYISYQRCCWANNIDNIINPQSEGLTVTCQIPGTTNAPVQNNAAVFNNFPPVVICSNKQFDFDFSATDPDGDSLVYSLCDPIGYTPPTTNDVNPDPDYAGPYSPIQWESGFDSQNPFGATSTISIDVSTGQFSLNPTTIGRFLTSICIEEYRNGVIINTESRIINFSVIECDKIIPFTVSTDNNGIILGGMGTGTEPTDTLLISEDCGTHEYLFHRDLDTTELVIEVILGGTATNGIDYPLVQDTLYIPIGVKDTSILFSGNFDGVNELTEDIRVIFRYFDICSGDYDTIQGYIILYDYRDLKLTIPIDSVNICPDLGELATLSAVVQDGIPPYNYEWFSLENESYPDSKDITIPSADIPDLINPYYSRVVDQCMKDTISNIALVYNQCPIIVPNVVTVNNDKINDVFIIKNLKDYPAVKLKIFNRWGQLLYENDDYKNDWLVHYDDGTPLTEGIYYYFAEVVNDKKYTYDDQEETLYQAQGFFHVIK